MIEANERHQLNDAALTTVVKIGVATAVIGLGIWLYDYAKQAFTFSIVRYGSPSISSGFLEVPITIRFNNPAPVAVNIDNLHADIFIQKYGQWVRVGIVDQPLSVPAGLTDQTLVPRIDISKIIGGGVASVLTLVTTALRSKAIPIKTDVTINYAGVALPTQSFINQISIA